MTEPYESVYTGKFIFLLGYLAREENLKLNNHCATLFAQNRGDTLIGDLVQSWSGRTFIFEFKRNAESIQTEFDKPGKRALLQRLGLPGRDREREVSARGHFIVYGQPAGASHAMSLRFLRYATIKHAAKQPTDGVDASVFLRKCLMDPSWGMTASEFAVYVRVLESCDAQSGGDRRASGAMGISALVANYDPASREVTFVTCDLVRTRELTLERSVRMLDRSRDRGRDRDSGPQR